MSDARVTGAHSAFSMSCRVEIDICASAQRVWSLLTDAVGFPRWNSTVTKIDGEIRDGGRLVVHVPGSTRTFTPTISGFVPMQRMIWTGGFAPMFKGVRVFSLTARSDASTNFVMEETFSGLILPLVGRAMPNFKPIFKQYAEDLKREAERVG